MKYSNKQRAGALAVRLGAHTSVSGQIEARRFSATFGEYAGEAIFASYAMGLTDIETLRFSTSSDAPRKISDLKISGDELIALGFAGRDIGKALSELFRMAVDEPSLNEKERLLSLARELMNNRGVK